MRKQCADGWRNGEILPQTLSFGLTKIVYSCLRLTSTYFVINGLKYFQLLTRAPRYTDYWIYFAAKLLPRHGARRMIKDGSYFPAKYVW